MTVGEVYEACQRISPFELQESWDNSGLLIGNKHAQVTQIVLCLDITYELIASLPMGALIISHHPLIFSKLSVLHMHTPLGRMIELMIQKGVSHIAMHTNVDKTHLNNYVATQVLGWERYEMNDFVCTTSLEISFETLLASVKKGFSLEKCVVVPTTRPIKRIALTTGSGGSLIERLDADVFITGDLKYHEALIAQEKGMGVIDVTHHASESFFGASLIDELKTLPINVTIHFTNNPMKII